MKSERQRKIIELISKQAIATQEQLADELRASGVDVTQATVSRDIKELRLTKTPTGDGQYRYVVPQERSAGDMLKRIRRVFRDSVVSIDNSANLIVIKTLPGTAQGVAAAVDNLEWDEIIGTIAGDDTILIVVKPIDAVDEVMIKIRRLNT